MITKVGYTPEAEKRVEKRPLMKKELLEEGKLILETLSDDFDLDSLSKAEQLEIKHIRKRLEELIKSIEKDNHLPDDYEEILQAGREKLYVESVDEIKEKYADDPDKLKAIDAFQAALDIAGFEQTFGSFADLTNAILYAFRSARAALQGEWKVAKQHILDAGISAIAIIPVADLIKILRLRKVPKLAKTTIKWARKARTYAKKEKLKRVNDVRKKIAA